MAPRLRAKPTTHARMQRAQTQFNELEVTPSRPGERTSQLVTDKEDHEATKTIMDKDSQAAKSFSWSDTGSTTNNTRRSSPADLIDLSTDNVWDFEESLAAFSSPNSDKNKLPDTMPLASAAQNYRSPTPIKRVDFSETASTTRRSSPFGERSTHQTMWDFDDSSPGSNAAPGTPGVPKHTPIPSHNRFPVDELYDSTPRRSIPTQAEVEPNDNQSAAGGRNKSPQSKAALQPKGKRQRQKAKKPICFDPLTQEIVDTPPAKKKKVATKRLTIVSALQESAKPSNSPATMPRKDQAQKRTRPRKKAKQGSLPSSTSIDLVAHASSPTQLMTENFPEGMQPPISGMNQGTSTSSGHVFATIKPLQKTTYSQPVTRDEPNSVETRLREPRTEQQIPNKRKISRQFSVSEKGSPVLSIVIPVEKPEPTRSNPSVVAEDSPEQLPMVPSSSFLRDESSGKSVENLPKTAFGDIEGKSSTQWLRRLSNKALVEKPKLSIGKKLHEEIMKSFLGHSGVSKNSDEAKKSSSAVSNHVENQMRHTLDQLIARLEERKTAVFDVAEVYRKSGEHSVAFLKEQCMQDGKNMAESLRKDGGLFGRKLQTTTETIGTRTSDRANMAAEFDSAMQTRHEAYGRTRLSLRAMRDQLTGEMGCGGSAV